MSNKFLTFVVEINAVDKLGDMWYINGTYKHIDRDYAKEFLTGQYSVMLDGIEVKGNKEVLLYDSNKCMLTYHESNDRIKFDEGFIASSIVVSTYKKESVKKN